MTQTQIKAVRLYVMPRVRKGEDWQRTMVETLQHFDWLTSSDEDEEFVMGIISACEDKIADEEEVAFSDPRNQGLSILS
jgi:hypothetical protein